MYRICVVIVIAVVLLWSCGQNNGDVDTLDQKTLRSGIVQAEFGKLYYEQQGTGSDIVMIHGAYLDRRNWDLQFNRFAEEYRVTRYDVRGHGKTESLDTNFTDYEDLLTICDSLDIQEAILMGLSMGGGIALDFALTYPERVKALVLIGPGIGGGEYDSPEYQVYGEELLPALQAEDFSQIVAIMLKYWSVGPGRSVAEVDSTFLDTMRTLMDENRKRWYLNSLVKRLDPPVIDRAEELTMPILIVNGSEDVVDILDNSEEFAGLAKNVRIELIQDAGHIVNMEKPEEFNDLAMKFIKTL